MVQNQLEVMITLRTWTKARAPRMKGGWKVAGTVCSRADFTLMIILSAGREVEEEEEVGEEDEEEHPDSSNGKLMYDWFRERKNGYCLRRTFKLSQKMERKRKWRYKDLLCANLFKMLPVVGKHTDKENTAEKGCRVSTSFKTHELMS